MRNVIRKYRSPRYAVLDAPVQSRLDERERQLFQQYLRGDSVPLLAETFREPASRIRQCIRHQRLLRVRELPLDFMPSVEFDRPDAEASICAPLPAPKRPLRKPRRPGGVPPYLADLYEVPLLTAEQELHLFRKFNFLKYRASKLRDGLDSGSPKTDVLDEIERLYEQAAETKNQLVRANLRLVVSIAKKFVRRRDDFYRLVSDGNLSLMKAVEKFDYSRGFKFSTYATWAIRKNFAGAFKGDMKRQDHFRQGSDELLDAAVEHRSEPGPQEAAQRGWETAVRGILGCLDEREKRVIKQRFGLNDFAHPCTLSEIGEELGVSKERVRQLEARAMTKLRTAAIAAKIELPNGEGELSRRPS